MKKSNFQKGIESYKKFNENGKKDIVEIPTKVQRVENINTPLLQQPANTSNASQSEMVKNGVFNNYSSVVDFTTNEFYILKELHRKNNWVAHSCHVVATNVVNTEPFFTLSSEKEVRDKTALAKLEKVLLKPNRNETWHTLSYKTVYSLFLLGNAYWQIIRTRNGDIHSIYSVPADTIRPIPYIDKQTGVLR
jgi:phage portal protein BeeE